MLAAVIRSALPSSHNKCDPYNCFLSLEIQPGIHEIALRTGCLSFDCLLYSARSVLAICVRGLVLAISSCRVLGDLYKISCPLYLHVVALNHVFELQSFPLQSG